MPAVGQRQQEGQLWSGMLTSGSIPEVFLNRGLNELGKLAFVTRGETKFLHMLHTRFPKSKIVTTREHPVAEISELSRTFKVEKVSTDTYHATFGLTNDKAAELQAEDILFNINLYAYVQFSQQLMAGQVIEAVGGVQGTNVGEDLNYYTGANPTGVAFGRTFGTNAAGDWFVDHEQMKVTLIGTKDSGGTGYTNVTVRRCSMGPDAKDRGGVEISRSLVNTAIAADTANATIKEGDMLVKSLPSFKEGTDAPNGLFKNPIIDHNFTQEFKYAVEMTKEANIEATKLRQTPLDINRMLVTRRMNLDIERQYLFGRKTKKLDYDGKVEYNVGGVIEFIKKDTDHIIDYGTPSITYPGLLDTAEKVFVLGGGVERDCFCGISVAVALKKAFHDNQHMRFDHKASKDFDIPIESIIGAGGKLNIIPLWTLQEAGWSNKMICIDTSVPSFVPTTHRGWDMKVEKDIQTKGTQIYKEQIVGIKGLERRNQQYHCIINFPNIA